MLHEFSTNSPDKKTRAVRFRFIKRARKISAVPWSHADGKIVLVVVVVLRVRDRLFIREPLRKLSPARAADAKSALLRSRSIINRRVDARNGDLFRLFANTSTAAQGGAIF